MANTQCIYCGSSSYGRPCIFSPTNTHVHMDEPGKCIYCGSTYQGGGCIFNPYGKFHVRGPEFLNRAAVKTEKAVFLNYMLGKLKPEVINESYVSPLDRFYKRISNIIFNIAEPLFEALSLNHTSVYASLPKPQLIKAVEYKQKFKKHLTEMSKTVRDASLELPPEIVEEYLIEAIIDSQDDTSKN